jgi:lysophospholipase L1-like esterase
LVTKGIDPPATTSALAGTKTITAAEKTSVEAIVDEFNGIIAELGDASSVPLVDIVADWWGASQVETPAPFRGYSGEFVLRAKDTTTFSLDGVHPNNLGQALCANAFIRVLNAEYGLGLAELDPADYAGQYSARSIDSRSLLQSVRTMVDVP